MAFDVIDPQSSDTALGILTEIDHHLYLTGNAQPQGVKIGRFVGQRYYAQNDGSHWVCTSTDGATAGGTTWRQWSIPSSVISALGLL